MTYSILTFIFRQQKVALSDVERGLQTCINSLAEKVETLIVLTLPPIPRLFSKNAPDHLIELERINDAIKKCCTNPSGTNFNSFNYNKI